MSTIAELRAYEILDSRGLPTVLARCRLTSGALGAASAPSGRSTGRWEAVEKRDGDRHRYQGLGCRRAVAGINGELNRVLSDTTFDQQADLDAALIELDGTSDKSRLGANALLAVSLAYCRAVAAERGVELYRHLAELVGSSTPRLPCLTVNLFSGGKHAGKQVALQDVLLVPYDATSIDEALVRARRVFAAAAELSAEKHGSRLLTADEGGLAPPFDRPEAMFEDALEAVDRAGYRQGEMALAVDVAATHFAVDGGYQLTDRVLNGSEMVRQIEQWVNRYPIVSVEDGVGEDDWPSWAMLMRALAGRALVLGDDLLCTNPDRIQRAVDEKAANALLLKVNQIGTLTEAAFALSLARTAGWCVVVSARSGETEDDWLADLAVGWSADYIKVGSVTQSERLAKYNRLLVIEAESGLPVARPHVPGEQN